MTREEKIVLIGENLTKLVSLFEPFFGGIVELGGFGEEISGKLNRVIGGALERIKTDFAQAYLDGLEDEDWERLSQWYGSGIPEKMERIGEACSAKMQPYMDSLKTQIDEILDDAA